MKALLQNAQVLICMGTGGVGKTTVSAAIGALAAQIGKRTLVLTIDPSQRLKTTLRLPNDGSIAPVHAEQLDGKLFGAVINSKKTFDNFVMQNAPSKESADKILKNKLYLQLSTTLSGSQEFTALESLYSAVLSKEFDLVILDTPPAQHALDFLRAPQKLTALFQDRITKWMRQTPGAKDGFLRGLFNAGTKQVLKTLELLTGSEFMTELADFFIQIQSWQDRLQSRTLKVQELLKNSQTHFIVVSSFERNKLIEAEQLATQLQSEGYQLQSLILNRALPHWMVNAPPQVGPWAQRWVTYFKERRAYSKILTALQDQGVKIDELPEMQEDIHSFQGVLALAEFLKGQK